MAKKNETQEPQVVIIPAELCPKELGLLSQGKLVHLQVYGMLTPDGVLVKEVEYKK